MNIKVKYGIDEFDKSTSMENVTIGQVVDDYEIKNALGYGDNVRVLIHGVEQPNAALVPDGATLVIETRANSKATREYDLDLIAA